MARKEVSEMSITGKRRRGKLESLAIYEAFVQWVHAEGYPALAAKLRTDKPGRVAGVRVSLKVKKQIEKEMDHGN